jgi:NADH-quinone oxidoreductase subunit C
VGRLSDTTTSDASTDTPALPGDALREGIVDELRSAIGDGLLATHLLPQRDLWVRVAPEAWVSAATALRSHGFEYFCFLSAIDWLPSPYGKGEDDPSATDDDDDEEDEDAEADDDAEQTEATDETPTDGPPAIKQGFAGGESRFQMLARLTDNRRHVGVTLKADVPDSMSMPTWVGVFAGANWHERETHEMFGIDFEGHPDLRNLYLPGQFEGYPLRKDFPLLSRMVKPWPGIVDVEPMPPEPTSPGEPASETAAAAPEATPDAAAGDPS